MASLLVDKSGKATLSNETFRRRAAPKPTKSLDTQKAKYFSEMKDCGIATGLATDAASKINLKGLTRLCKALRHNPLKDKSNIVKTAIKIADLKACPEAYETLDWLYNKCELKVDQVDPIIENLAKEPYEEKAVSRFKIYNFLLEETAISADKALSCINTITARYSDLDSADRAIVLNDYNGLKILVKNYQGRGDSEKVGALVDKVIVLTEKVRFPAIVYLALDPLVNRHGIDVDLACNSIADIANSVDAGINETRDTLGVVNKLVDQVGFDINIPPKDAVATKARLLTEAAGICNLKQEVEVEPVKKRKKTAQPKDFNRYAMLTYRELVHRHGLFSKEETGDDSLACETVKQIAEKLYSDHESTADHDFFPQFNSLMDSYRGGESSKVILAGAAAAMAAETMLDATSFSPLLSLGQEITDLGYQAEEFGMIRALSNISELYENIAPEHRRAWIRLQIQFQGAVAEPIPCLVGDLLQDETGDGDIYDLIKRLEKDNSDAWYVIIRNAGMSSENASGFINNFLLNLGQQALSSFSKLGSAVLKVEK